MVLKRDISIYFINIDKTDVKDHFTLIITNNKKPDTLSEETNPSSASKRSGNKITVLLAYTIFK